MFADCLWLRVFQLELAQSGKFNSQIHVEFTWETQSQEFYDSEDDLDERVSRCLRRLSLFLLGLRFDTIGMQNKEPSIGYRFLKLKDKRSTYLLLCLRWARYLKIALRPPTEAVDPPLPAGVCLAMATAPQAAGPAKPTRTSTSCTEIPLPTAPPLEPRHHHHFQRNVCREVNFWYWHSSIISLLISLCYLCVLWQVH